MYCAFSNLWKLWDHDRESDLAVFTAVGNPAAVPGHDCPRSGQADSIAAGSAGAGGVRPVKAVEY